MLPRRFTGNTDPQYRQQRILHKFQTRSIKDYICDSAKAGLASKNSAGYAGLPRCRGNLLLLSKSLMLISNTPDMRDKSLDIVSHILQYCRPNTNCKPTRAAATQHCTDPLYHLLRWVIGHGALQASNTVDTWTVGCLYPVKNVMDTGLGFE